MVIFTQTFYTTEAEMNIGILHPGDMGISVAGSAQNSGHKAYWASAGRGEKTRARAEKYNLSDAGSLESLCRVCGTIVSICPPHAAENVTGQVIATGFHGLYLDANAI